MERSWFAQKDGKNIDLEGCYGFSSSTQPSLKQRVQREDTWAHRLKQVALMDL